MNQITTNKYYSHQQTIDQLAQAHLHHHILKVVAKRMHPESKQLVLQKHLCDHCVQKKPDLSNKTTVSNKKHKPTPSKLNKSVCQQEQQLMENRIQQGQQKQEKGQQSKKMGKGLVRQALNKRKKNLQIVSKVINENIYTMKTTRQTSSQFVNKKMLHKLQQQNMQKEIKIKALEQQLLQLRQKLMEQMPFHLSFKQKEHSQHQIPFSLDKISQINTERYSRHSIANDDQKEYFSQNNINLRGTNMENTKEYDYDQVLLRIIKNQALQLQKRMPYRKSQSELRYFCKHF